MSDYSRFIAYLYLYEKDGRKTGAGHARVEVRQGSCKLSIHIKQGDDAALQRDVFYYSRKPDADQGIAVLKIGIIRIINGTGQASFENSTQNLNQSGLSFSNIHGLVLCGDGQSSYIAGDWEGKELSPEAVAGIYAKKELGQRPPLPAHPEEKHPDRMPMRRREEAGTVIAADEPKKNKAPASADENPFVIVSERPKPSQTAKDGMPQAAAEKKEMQEQPVIVGPGMQKPQPQPPPPAPAEEARLPIVQPVKEEAKKEAEKHAQAHIPENYIGKQMPWQDKKEARDILDCNERMYPFQDSEIVECVKIEPKDLGKLPVECWVLGNNSFLLHSYCNYKYLLFAKRMNRMKCEYLLMVPGVYQQREKVMAKMFGFEQFKCVRCRELRVGEFGYWYRSIPF